MSGLIQFLEESLVAFVRERVPMSEWKHIYARRCIEGRMEDDDLNELKDYCFSELMNEVDWNVIVDHFKQLAKSRGVESGSEDEEESDEENSQTSSDGF